MVFTQVKPNHFNGVDEAAVLSVQQLQDVALRAECLQSLSLVCL